MSVPWRSSGGIARKIALASIIISAVSGIGLGGISAYGDFRRSFASAIENSERLLRAALPQLESAYRDLDLVATQTTLGRLAEAPLVHSLSLRDLVFAPEDLRTVNIGRLAVQSDLPAESRSALGRLVPRDWLSGRLEFDLSAPRSPEPIARLNVDLSFAGLYDELGRRAISVVAVTVLQALMIAGILFVLIRSLVIRPLPDRLAFMRHGVDAAEERARFGAARRQLAQRRGAQHPHVLTHGADLVGDHPGRVAGTKRPPPQARRDHLCACRAMPAVHRRQPVMAVLRTGQQPQLFRPEGQARGRDPICATLRPMASAMIFAVASAEWRPCEAPVPAVGWRLISSSSA